MDDGSDEGGSGGCQDMTRAVGDGTSEHVRGQRYQRRQGVESWKRVGSQRRGQWKGGTEGENLGSGG